MTAWLLRVRQTSLDLTRSFSTVPRPHVGIMGHHPERFTQTVVLSNGASFTRRTTSPRPLLRLTKDTRNHPLWNPTTQMELDDESGTLSKFTKRFGDMEDLNDLSFFEMEDSESK